MLHSSSDIFEWHSKSEAFWGHFSTLASLKLWCITCTSLRCLADSSKVFIGPSEYAFLITPMLIALLCTKYPCGCGPPFLTLVKRIMILEPSFQFACSVLWIWKICYLKVTNIYFPEVSQPSFSSFWVHQYRLADILLQMQNCELFSKDICVFLCTSSPLLCCLGSQRRYDCLQEGWYSSLISLTDIWLLLYSDCELPLKSCLYQNMQPTYC